MNRYWKFILAVVATVISGVGALAVFAAPNVPGAMYTKSILAALTAALTLLASFITDGVSTSEWLQIGVAVLGAIGVWSVPNSTNEAMSANPRSEGFLK